jgi:hypothetical protein
VQATRTVVPTRTVVVTPTQAPEECLTLGEKLHLLIGILIRFGAEEGDRHYKAKYDLNDDGKIGWKDLKVLFETPTCRKSFHRR